MTKSAWLAQRFENWVLSVFPILFTNLLHESPPNLNFSKHIFVFVVKDYLKVKRIIFNGTSRRLPSLPLSLFLSVTAIWVFGVSGLGVQNYLDFWLRMIEFEGNFEMQQWRKLKIMKHGLGNIHIWRQIFFGHFWPTTAFYNKLWIR